MSPSTKGARKRVCGERSCILFSLVFLPRRQLFFSNKKPRRVIHLCFFCYNYRRLIFASCFSRLDLSIHTHSKCLPPMPPSPRSSRPTLRCDDFPCGSLHPSSFDRSTGFCATCPLPDDISMLEGGTPPRLLILYILTRRLCIGPCCLCDRLLCFFHVRRW